MTSDHWITIKGLSSLDGLSRWVGDIDEVFHQPKVIVPLVHAIGMEVSGFFNSEVTPLGRSWQPLSPMTQRTRSERGYSPARPILEQSGQLRNLAVDSFINYKGGSGYRKSVTSPYGNHESLSISANYVGGIFSATISGSRVENQYGKRMDYGKFRVGSRDRDRWNHIPSRPFWGLNQRMFDWGVPQMMLVFMTEWQARSRSVWE